MQKKLGYMSGFSALNFIFDIVTDVYIWCLYYASYLWLLRSSCIEKRDLPSINICAKERTNNRTNERMNG